MLYFYVYIDENRQRRRKIGKTQTILTRIRHQMNRSPAKMVVGGTAIGHQEGNEP